MVNMIHLQKSLGQAKKVAIAAFVALVFVSLSMLGITIVGNEMSKDMRPAESGSSALQDNEGRTIQMQSEQIALDIYQLPTQSPETLENMKHITLPVQFGDSDSDVVDAHYKLAGFHKGESSLILFTSIGDQITISPTVASLTTAAGATYEIGGGPGSERRRLQVGTSGKILADKSLPAVSDDVDACLTSPCLNGGHCWPIDSERFTCSCDDTGFTGSLCEAEVDECASQPCENQGECVDGPKTYACACLAVRFLCSCSTVRVYSCP